MSESWDKWDLTKITSAHQRVECTYSVFVRTDQDIFPQFSIIRQRLEKFCEEKSLYLTSDPPQDHYIPYLGESLPPNHVIIKNSVKGDFWVVKEQTYRLLPKAPVNLPELIEQIEDSFPSTFIEIRASFGPFLDRQPH